jgi:hypothetical protein
MVSVPMTTVTALVVVFHSLAARGARRAVELGHRPCLSRRHTDEPRTRARRIVNRVRDSACRRATGGRTVRAIRAGAARGTCQGWSVVIASGPRTARGRPFFGRGGIQRSCTARAARHGPGLFRVARNLVIDAHRAQSARPRQVLDDLPGGAGSADGGTDSMLKCFGASRCARARLQRGPLQRGGGWVARSARGHRQVPLPLRHACTSRPRGLAR